MATPRSPDHRRSIAARRLCPPADAHRDELLYTEQGPAWLRKQWINLPRMRAEGIPVLGFTLYSLTDQIDWDIALSERRGTVNGCGLYDLARRPNPVAHEYRALLTEFAAMRHPNLTV